MLERCLLTLLLCTLFASTAAAQAAPDPVMPRDTAEERRSDDEVYARLELTMGFVGGWGRYADLALGQGSLPAGAIEGGPAGGAAMAGLRYDLRLVVSIVRMTIGGDLMWGLFSAAREREVSGMVLRDDRLFDGALRFGLGLEASLDGVRLFADVLGTVHFVENALVVNGEPASTSATSFAPGARIGARIAIVPHFFVQVSIDASPFGPSWIGGDLSVGGAFE